jgi:hypothetical protein
MSKLLYLDLTTDLKACGQEICNSIGITYSLLYEEIMFKISFPNYPQKKKKKIEGMVTIVFLYKISAIALVKLGNQQPFLPL